MSDDFYFDVFLSHSSMDKTVVRDMAERLRKDGVKVWFDEWVLKPGDNIPAKIEDGLERSRVLVLCMSAHAFGSDWAQLESGTFRFRDPLNKERRLLPLRLDEAPIKGSLAQFLYINWMPGHRDEEYPKLLESSRAPIDLPKAELQNLPKLLSARTIELKCGFVNFETYSFGSDWERVLTSGDDGKIRLWELERGHCVRVLKGHGRGRIMGLAWSADEYLALSGASDATIRLWDVQTGRCRKEITGHSAEVCSIAWGQDHRRAASGSRDKTVRLWDVETGRCLRVMEGHSGSILSVAWSADNKCILSASSDRTLRIWDHCCPK